MNKGILYFTIAVVIYLIATKLIKKKQTPETANEGGGSGGGGGSQGAMPIFSPIYPQPAQMQKQRIPTIKKPPKVITVSRGR